MKPRARVVVADDHAPTREVVRQALDEGGFDVRAAVRDASAAVKAVLEHAADIALLDVNMPGGGVNAAAELARVRPNTAVVMLTVSQDDADLLAAIRAGAVGYLVKGLSAPELVAALERVLAGESVVPPALVRTLVDAFQAQSRSSRLRRAPRAQSLSERELEVLHLLEAGRTTAQIARALIVSNATVRSHIAAILRKLEVPDRESALRLIRAERDH